MILTTKDRVIMRVGLIKQKYNIHIYTIIPVDRQRVALILIP